MAVITQNEAVFTGVSYDSFKDELLITVILIKSVTGEELQCSHCICI